MKNILILIPFLIIPCFNSLKGQYKEEDIIVKENGRIILAGHLFENYLDSEHTWENYKETILANSPEMRIVHEKQLSWGSIDSVKFKEDVQKYNKEDWARYFNVYSTETINYLYDSLIVKANHILNPVNGKPVDLCFFLPYGSCFINPGEERSTIFISLLIDPRDIQKIMAHEYAHFLHIQRRPAEPFRFKNELVSEGLAVYLTTLVNKVDISKAIPFMPESSVKWCFENEGLIKDALKSDLNDTTFVSLKKFIADGSVATPPPGFVEKTAYFAGYRIINACVKKGMSLEEIASLGSDTVIARSGYFKP